MLSCKAWAAALLLGQGLAAGGTFDFDAPGVSLERAVSELGVRLGVRLDVAPPIQDEIVVIHVTDVRFEDLYERIAKVAHAEWQTTSQGRLLVRTKEVQAALRAASLKFRADHIREVLQKVAEPLGREFTADDARTLRDALLDSANRNGGVGTHPAFDGAFSRGPLARLTVRLLLSVSAEQLADLRYGARRVFAYKPTKLQYPFGPGAGDAFASYAKEQNVWSAVAAGTEYKPLYAGDPLGNLRPVTETEQGFQIVVKHGQMDSMLFCNLVLPKPEVPDSVLYQAIADPANRRAMSFAGAAKFEVPESASSLLRWVIACTIRPSEQAVASPSREDLALLQDPTKFDVAGAIAECAIRKRFADRDLVALFSDKGALLCYSLFPFQSKPEPFDLCFADLTEERVSADGSWTLVEPADPYEATALRTPRRALADLIANSRTTKQITFAQLAQFNSVLEEPSVLMFFYLGPLGYSGYQNAGSPQSWLVSRLYGSLSAGLREALKQGRRVAYGDLTVAQRQRFLDLALSDMVSSTQEMGPGLSRYAGQIADPTNLLTQGMPAEVPLTLDIKSDFAPFAYAKTGDAYRPLYQAPASSIASIEKRKSDPQGRPSRSLVPDGYAMGEVVTYTFRIQYAERMWQTFIVTEERTDPKATPGDWTKLPPDVVQEIKKLIDGGE